MTAILRGGEEGGVDVDDDVVVDVEEIEVEEPCFATNPGSMTENGLLLRVKPTIFAAGSRAKTSIGETEFGLS